MLPVFVENGACVSKHWFRAAWVQGIYITLLIFVLMIITRQRSWGKVIFWVMCVSVCSQGVPCDHYSWCIGPHCAAPPPAPQPQLPLDMEPHWSGTPSAASDIRCRPYKFVHFRTHAPTSADIWWLLNHVCWHWRTVHLLLECFLVITYVCGNFHGIRCLQ